MFPCCSGYCIRAPQCAWLIKLPAYAFCCRPFGTCTNDTFFYIFRSASRCQSCGYSRVMLLTVHRREGVRFAVNIHWIAKERVIINWSRRFDVLSSMKMWRKKGGSTRWRDLVGPSTLASTTELMATSSPKSCLVFYFNSPVRERRSGRCAAWPEDCFGNTAGG